MKDHILNCGERYEDMIDHRSYTHNLHVSSCEIKAWKKIKTGLSGIRNYDLCGTGAVHLHPLRTHRVTSSQIT